MLKTILGSLDRLVLSGARNFFLTGGQLTGIDRQTLDEYDELIEWFSIGAEMLCIKKPESTISPNL